MDKVTKTYESMNRKLDSLKDKVGEKKFIELIGPISAWLDKEIIEAGKKLEKRPNPLSYKDAESAINVLEKETDFLKVLEKKIDKILKEN